MRKVETKATKQVTAKIAVGCAETCNIQEFGFPFLCPKGRGFAIISMAQRSHQRRECFMGSACSISIVQLGRPASKPLDALGDRRMGREQIREADPAEQRRNDEEVCVRWRSRSEEHTSELQSLRHL